MLASIIRPAALIQHTDSRRAVLLRNKHGGIQYEGFLAHRTPHKSASLPGLLLMWRFALLQAERLAQPALLKVSEGLCLMVWLLKDSHTHIHALILKDEPHIVPPRHPQILPRRIFFFYQLSGASCPRKINQPRPLFCVCFLIYPALVILLRQPATALCVCVCVSQLLSTPVWLNLHTPLCVSDNGVSSVHGGLSLYP